MKTIVIYKSSTGFTKTYAKWIQEELDCDCVSLKDIKTIDLSKYNQVIFGGSIMAGNVSGLDKIKEYVHHQNLIVFATGATVQNADSVIEKIKQDALSALGYNVPFYYYEAGINYDKMSFFSKTMLKMMYKSLRKKKERSDEETGMMKALAESFDHSDKKKIEELINKAKAFG